MPRPGIEKKRSAPAGVTTFAPDLILAVCRCKEKNDIPTHSEAMERVLRRAEKLDLHKLTDEEFEQYADAIEAAGVKPELLKTH